jgi:hypothetical protein
MSIVALIPQDDKPKAWIVTKILHRFSLQFACEDELLHCLWRKTEYFAQGASGLPKVPESGQ